MSRRGLMRSGGLLPCLVLLVSMTAACNENVRRPAILAVPEKSAGAPADVTAPEVAAPPVFQKVSPQDNPGLMTVPPASDLAAGGPYRLEIEDKLDISVYGEEDLQHVEVPVRPDGMISFAFIGDVQAAGRSIEEVRSDMTEKLSHFLRSPQVTVIAKQFAQKKVFIGGEVKTPGIVYLGGRESTLLDAIYKAGLTTDKADLEGAYLMRGNKVVDTDFKQLVRGDMSRNVRLVDQDMVFIPENTRRYVYVLGEVRTSLAVETQEPIPIVRALAQAGWLNLGSRKKEIAVIRGDLKAPEIAIVDAKALTQGDLSQNIFVKPGDIVYVAPGALAKFNYVIDEVLRVISPVVQATIVSNTLNPPTRVVK
jgi:polysaccharide biosynthesis/export protein